MKTKLSIYEKQLDFFEKKYNLKFEQFQQNFHNIQHSLIEKEDDFIEWEGMLHSYNSIKKKMKAIQENQPFTAIIDYKKRIEDYLSSV